MTDKTTIIAGLNVDPARNCIAGRRHQNIEAAELADPPRLG